MARKPTESVAPSRQLSVQDLERGIARLRKRLDALRSFDPSQMREERPAELLTLESSIETALTKTFGHNTPEHSRYGAATKLVWRRMVFGGDSPSLSKHQEVVRRNVDVAGALISEAIQGLEEELAEEKDTVLQPVENVNTASRRVFVVHGHDDGAKETVARFLMKIGFVPIILHEQANSGQTIIEKFEKHGDVGFAVVLLTPDDVGGPKGGPQQARARQNVILELGYFIAKLGRARVCALKQGELEVPSDFAGVVYETMDAAGAWHQALGRELTAAGYEVDWNAVMRP